MRDIEIIKTELEYTAVDRRKARDHADNMSDRLKELVVEASEAGVSNREIRALTNVAPESIRAWLRRG